MNAKVVALNHYTQVEEIARARQTIDELRFALHSTIRQLSALSAAISIERVKCVDVMDQAHAVLMATLPGGKDASPLAGQFSATPSHEGAVSAGGAALDAMSKPQRQETLRDAITDIFSLRPQS